MSALRKDYRLAIAIPSSLVSEVPHLREKTVVIGQIARTAAIHRVEEIYIYRDAPDEARLIRLLLSYLETPQYLRKRLFKMMAELRYVGVLPPLRTPHHPLERRSGNLEKGEFREGVVLSEEEGEFLVDIGVEVPARVTGRGPSVGSRATIRITDVRPGLRGRFSGRKDVESYWGYGIHVVGGGLAKLASRDDFDLKLATTRYAPPFREIESQFRARLAEAKGVLVAFGSPRNGIREILSKDRLAVSDAFDFSANMIPDQGSVTVRTEEAIAASLSLIGMLR